MMLALSVLAVLLLIGLAYLMNFRVQPSLDEAQARDEAEARLAGFRATDVVLAKDGRGAVLLGADRSLAILLPFGDSWISRRVERGVEMAHRGGVLIVKLSEPMLAEARLPLEPLPGWLQEWVA